jgi:hypothetical protein
MKKISSAVSQVTTICAVESAFGHSRYVIQNLERIITALI